MEALNPVLQPLQRVWRGLSRPQQIGLGLVGATLVALLVFVSTVGHGADSAIAFSGLNNDDEAAIVQKLKDAKIPYTLQDGGTIRVPSAQVQDARLATAGMGLNGQPQSGSGFELFNQPTFGQTDFTQKVNYQRALETELERSINQMAAVDSSRVHLVVPDQTLFSSQQAPTTASIMLKLKPGQHLDTAQARSISNLVSGSVQGLKPENINIVDVNGNTLTPTNGADPTVGLSSTQIQTQQGYESTMERNLQAMLDSVLGPGKASVKVSAVMNWDQVEETDESYTPSDPTQTPVLTNHSITEQTTGGSTGVGGVPGAAANNGSGVPTYQGATSGSGGSTSKTDTQTTYQLNKTTQKTVHAPGALTRLSVSVMVDDDPNNPNTALIQSVQNAVNAAAGIDPSRGDMLTVTSLPFNRQQFLDDQQALKDASQQEQVMSYAHLAALALGPLVMLGLLFFLFKRGSKKNKKVIVLETPGSAPDAASASTTAEDAVAAAVPVVTSKTGKPVGQPIAEDPQKVYIREQIQNLGKSNPGTVAQLIQTWMDEDRRN